MKFCFKSTAIASSRVSVQQSAVCERGCIRLLFFSRWDFVVPSCEI